MNEQEIMVEWNSLLASAKNGMEINGAIRSIKYRVQTDGDCIVFVSLLSEPKVRFRDYIRLIEALEDLGAYRVTTRHLQDYGLNTPTYVLALYNHIHQIPPMDERYDALVDAIQKPVPNHVPKRPALAAEVSESEED